MPHLSAAAIRRNLLTNTFGQSLIYCDEIGSTNTELKRLADQDAPEGMLLVADEQTAGRGRFERVWRAPAGSSLLTSLLFRPTFLPPTRAQYLTMLCALAAADATKTQAGISAGLKWPNDLVHEGRKLAGLLTELSISGETLDWIVVGMGMNVNLDLSLFAESEPDSGLPLGQTATSLQTILGCPVSRLSLLQAYLEAVERRYDALKRGETPYADWVTKLTTLGQSVTVAGTEMIFHGLAEGVDESGALLLRLADGRLERVFAGDVSLR